MPKDTSQQVKRLLEPIYDEKQWYEKLKTLDPAEAVPILASILLDEAEGQWRRSRAAIILVDIHDERAIPPLIEALAASDPVLRARVACYLGRLERVEEKVIKQLIKGLGDEDYFVRECSAKTLGQFKCVEALPALEEMGNTDIVPNNREVARRAIEAIKKDRE